MAVKVGERAPYFSAPSSLGRHVSLADYRGRTVVVYFFLRAMSISRACVQEARRFRDNYPDLLALGCEVIGISTDRLAPTCAFAQEHQVTFPLLSDEDHSIARAWGVMRTLLPIAERVTFVVDEEQIVRAVFRHEVQVSRHLDDVLKYVRGARGQVAGAAAPRR